MSFGRWLLTHSLSLFLAAMLLAAWFWRDELELERAWAQLRQVGSEMQLAEAEQQPEATETDAGSTVEPQPAKSASGQRQEREAPAQSAPASTASASREVPVSGNAEAPRSNTRPAPDIDPRLAEARKAFWSRQFDRAIAAYQSLIDEYPKNPDYLGELGNIYYNLNRFARAAELFEQAGLLLVEQGDLERAGQLLPALSSLDRDRGQRLRQVIEQARAAGGDSQS